MNKHIFERKTGFKSSALQAKYQLLHTVQQSKARKKHLKKNNLKTNHQNNTM